MQDSKSQPYFLSVPHPHQYQIHRCNGRKALVPLLLLFTVLTTSALYALNIPLLGIAWRTDDLGITRLRVPSSTRNPAYLIKASRGAVASENELCSGIGVDTLKAGGNAVDAAVSTTLCIGVVNMFS